METICLYFIILFFPFQSSFCKNLFQLVVYFRNFLFLILTHSLDILRKRFTHGKFKIYPQIFNNAWDCGCCSKSFSLCLLQLSNKHRWIEIGLGSLPFVKASVISACINNVYVQKLCINLFPKYKLYSVIIHHLQLPG